MTIQTRLLPENDHRVVTRFDGWIGDVDAGPPSNVARAIMRDMPAPTASEVEAATMTRATGHFVSLLCEKYPDTDSISATCTN
jgi:hypothetical protein